MPDYKEPLRQLTGALQKHIWCVILFSLWFAFWVVAFAYARKPGDIISWASLALSIVVIVYMFLQAYQMRNLIAEGHQLLATAVGEKLETIERRYGNMIDQLSQLDHRTGLDSPLTGHQFEFSASRGRIINLFVFYTLGRSSALQKRFSLLDIVHIIHIDNPLLPKYSTDAAYQEDARRLEALYTYGVVHTIECFLPPNSIDATDMEEISVRELPADFLTHISKEIAERRGPAPANAAFPKWVNGVTAGIDEYFEHQ